MHSLVVQTTPWLAVIRSPGKPGRNLWIVQCVYIMYRFLLHCAQVRNQSTIFYIIMIMQNAFSSGAIVAQTTLPKHYVYNLTWLLGHDRPFRPTSTAQGRRPRTILESLNSQLMPQHTCLIALQTQHTTEPRRYTYSQCI